MSIDDFVDRYKDKHVEVIAGKPMGIASLSPKAQTCQPILFAGFEARGLIFGAPIALALGIPFVPLRKPGKLPGRALAFILASIDLTWIPPHPSAGAAAETISAEYQLEYGSDKIEMHVGSVKKGQRVVLLDDLIATGGTMGAGILLMKQASLCDALRDHLPADPWPMRSVCGH